MLFYVYVLKSKSSGKSYIGHSNNLHNRITEHNNGKSRATRGKGPWDMVYYEIFYSRSDAVRREIHFKSIKGRLELKAKDIL